MPFLNKILLLKLKFEVIGNTPPVIKLFSYSFLSFHDESEVPEKTAEFESYHATSPSFDG
jgi:hypothetical protein